ncbi:MAG TPA: hypothetical protein EYP65_00180 [Armatimonadetes bacterium]|nr:hypothetical protein [Armatimonadota bacterium]
MERNQEAKGLRWSRRVAAASGGMLVTALVLWAVLAITQVLVRAHPPSGSGALLVVWWVSYGSLIFSVCVGGFVTGRFAYDAPATAGLIMSLSFFLFCLGFVGLGPGAPPSLSTPGGAVLTLVTMVAVGVLFSTLGAVAKVAKLAKGRG